MKLTDVNTIYATGAAAMYAVKEVLKAAGWVVNQSSDGTTYNAAGDQISHGGAGANGMANSNAWFEIQEPEANGRSYTVQRDTVNNWEYRVKMSAAAGFAGGTPGAIQTPSATDEVTLLGSGTDAAPVHVPLFPTTDGSYRLHAIAESTPVGPAGNRVYGFWIWTTQTGSGVLTTLWLQEAMAVGTYVPLSGTRLVPTDGDADPAFYICTAAGSNAFSPQTATAPGWAAQVRASSAARAWFDYGGGGAEFGECRSVNFEIASASAIHFGQTMGTGAYGYDVGHPCTIIHGIAGLDVTRIGMKGITSRVYNSGTSRAYPDTINLSTDAYCYAGQVLLPFEDGTAPLL